MGETARPAKANCVRILSTGRSLPWVLSLTITASGCKPIGGAVYECTGVLRNFQLEAPVEFSACGFPVPVSCSRVLSCWRCGGWGPESVESLVTVSDGVDLYCLCRPPCCTADGYKPGLQMCRRQVDMVSRWNLQYTTHCRCVPATSC
jgi:hypothetical protein